MKFFQRMEAPNHVLGDLPCVLMGQGALVIGLEGLDGAVEGFKIARFRGACA